MAAVKVVICCSFACLFVLAACTPPPPPATLAPVSTSVPATPVAVVATATADSSPTVAIAPTMVPTSPPASVAPATSTRTPTLVRFTPSVTRSTVTPSVTATSAPTQVLSAACNNSAGRIDSFLMPGKWIRDLSTIPVLSGSVTVDTTANAPNFQYWKLEYSGDDRRSWNTIVTGRTPLVDIMGYAWSTTVLPNGDYWVRTIVVDKSGNFADPCEIRVMIRNATPTAASASAIGCRDARVTILYPRQDQLVRDPRLVFQATLERDVFSYYQMQFSSDRNTWINIGPRVGLFPTSNYLAPWDLSSIAPGDYWVRVLVVDKTGNYGDPCSVHISIVKSTPTPLPSNACGVAGATISGISIARPNGTLSIVRDFSQPIPVRSSIGVFGAADRANLKVYFLQYSQDQNTWIEIAPRYSMPHQDGVSTMASWQTSSVPNGDYWLHVRVIDNANNYVDSCGVHLVVNN